MDLSFVTLRAFKNLDVIKNDFQFGGAEHIGVPTLTSLAFNYQGKKVLFEECIMTINQEKNIVTTPMEGRDGTVKEYISDGDYSLSVEAAVCSYIIDQKDFTDFKTSHDYPKEQIEKVLHFLKIKDTLEVQSDFLTLFGIQNVVVKSFAVSQETHSNRQAFSIQLLSDLPFEITIRNNV